MAKKNPLPVEQSAMPTISKPDKDDEMRSRARYALEDIERAEAHKNDKELMRHVKKAAREKVKNLKKVC